MCTSSANHWLLGPPTGSELRDESSRVLCIVTGSSLFCVAASFLTRCRGGLIFVHVAAATSASCRGTSLQNIAFQMFLQLQTLRRVSFCRPHFFSATLCSVFLRWQYHLRVAASKATCALHIADGAMVVVDCIEGSPLRSVSLQSCWWIRPLHGQRVFFSIGRPVRPSPSNAHAGCGGQVHRFCRQPRWA